MNNNDLELTKEEIIETILVESKKEITINQLSEILNITPLEVLGYIDELEKMDKQLVISKKDNGITILNNGDLFFSVDKNYTIPTDKDNNKKIMLISDPRFGSIFSQKNYLNQMYLKAYENDIDTVFLAGNITEGLYKINSQSEYYKDLYAQDTMKQVEDVINNFPLVKGITTYFIIGPKDKTHLTKNKINIGKKISEERKDMIFLGTNRANIFIDNVSIIIQNLPLAKTYTTSYRPEQAIKALRSENKPDILIYGGLCQLDSFYSRDILTFSVPSLVGTTSEMNAKRYDNVIGCQFLTIHTNGIGKMIDFDYYDNLLYQSNEKDYMKVKTLKKETNNEQR